MPADHLFQRLVVVADSDAGVGLAVHFHRLNGYREHDPALPVFHGIATHTGMSGGVHFGKCAPDVLSRAMAALGIQIGAVFVEQVQAAVFPCRLLLVEQAQTGPDRLPVGVILQVAAPLAQHVPVPLGEHGEGLVHLLIGLQQVFGALGVKLVLDIDHIPHDARHKHGSQQDRQRDLLFAPLHILRLLLRRFVYFYCLNFFSKDG